MLKLEEIPKNIKNLVKGKIFQEENEVSFLLKKEEHKNFIECFAKTPLIC